LKKQISQIVNNNDFSKKDLPFVASTVFNSLEVRKLRAQFSELYNRELAENPLLKDPKKGKEAALLLQALATEL
jgi:hypothetical protein